MTTRRDGGWVRYSDHADAIANLQRERDEARNDEWLAAISAVQYMAANWDQDCRTEERRAALAEAAESIVDELRAAGPTEYLDIKWKDAQNAVAAEQKAALADARAQTSEAEAATLRARLEAVEGARQFNFNVYYPHDRIGDKEPPPLEIEAAARAMYERRHNFPACTATLPWVEFQKKFEQRAEDYMKAARVALIAAAAIRAALQEPQT